VCALDERGTPHCILLDEKGLTVLSADGAALAGAQRLALVSLDVTDDHACGLDAAGALYCWGTERAGSLGGRGELAEPTRLDAGPFAEVQVAPEATCVRDRGGALSCWGARYGDGSATRASVALPEAARAFDLGEAHGCALTVAGEVLCWGEDVDGQLGQGVLEGSPTPVHVLSGAYAIATGARHSCARTQASVWCWGSNAFGAVRPPRPIAAGEAARYRGFDSATRYLGVAGAQGVACAIEADGDLACWGEPAFNSIPVRHPQSVPQLAEPRGGFTHVALAPRLGCGLRNGGELRCWGMGLTDLGVGAGSASAATPVRSDARFADLAVADGALCTLDALGRLACWGSNLGGRVGPTNQGSGAAASVSLPGRTVTDVALNGAAGFAIDSAHVLYGWGDRNGTWQAPSVLAPGTAFHEVAAEGRYACALDAAGSLYCWGYGPLISELFGLGQDVPVDAPQRVGSASGYRGLSVGNEHACVIDAAGAPLCAGGLATGADPLTPLAEGAHAEHVSAGALCAVDTDGRMR